MMQASLVLGRAVVMDRDKVEPSDADHLPPGWQTKTHEGRPYYIDPQKKSHWERPAYSFRQACSELKVPPLLNATRTHTSPLLVHLSPLPRLMFSCHVIRGKTVPGWRR